eukprot:1993899-Pyramimonas_sp.AAC.1
MGTRRLDVAYQPIETTTACQIENLHQYNRRVLAEDTLVGVVRLVEGLSTDPARLDDRDRALSALVGLTTDTEGLGDLDREALGESDRVRRDPGPWVRLKAHSR